MAEIHHSRPSNTFGSAVQERRERLNLTRAELAHRMSVSPSFVEYIERGRRGMDLDDIVRLANILVTEPAALLGRYFHDRSPAAYRVLFPASVPDIHSEPRDIVDDVHHRLDSLPRPVRSSVEATINSVYDLLQTRPR